MLVDSHCHLQMLDLSSYENNLDNLVQEARDQGVTHILCVATELANAQEVIEIATRYEDISASVGVHPSEKMIAEPTDTDLIKLANHNKVVAIGETGLDYYYNDSGLEIMRERFRTHIRVARLLQKPLIVHSRNAREDTIQILKDEQANQVRGVMHCFTENWEMAKQALDLGFFISFSGILTFKNAQDLVELADKIPLENILIETDAPYLTPVPLRGKPNLPQYVKYVAAKIAEIKKISYEKVAEQTTKNFKELFLKS